MKTGAGLALVAIGAIFAFAVKAHPSWLNLQVVGWVLMVVGVAGLVIPRRGYGWLRRRLVVRRAPNGALITTPAGSAPPGSVVTGTVPAAPGEVVEVTEGGPDAPLPGWQLSKADVERLGVTNPPRNGTSETVEEFRPE